jgi:hypothetical protein
MTPRIVFALALVAAGGRPLPAQPPPVRTSSPSEHARAELDDLRSALESAVGRADRVGLLPGARGAGRAYRLKGYGAVLVLSPHALPARRIVLRPRGAPDTEAVRAVMQARRGLEQSLARATSSEMRQEIQRSLERLRQTEAALRRSTPAPPEGPKVVITVPEGTFEVAPVDLGDLEWELEAQMAAQAEWLREVEAAQLEWTRASEDELRTHLRAVEEQAEALRAEAERARRQAEREVRTRLAPPARPRPPAPAGASVPSAPEAPPAPLAPAAPAVEPAGAPAPPVLAEAPEAPPPPWRFWFDLSPEAEETETPDAESVVAAVRQGLGSGLESYRRPLTSLRPDEFVAVVVDFLPDRLLRTRPARTLVLRVRVRDLQERQAGRLSAEEFRRRLEIEEN